jgi:hypothetical protein
MKRGRHTNNSTRLNWKKIDASGGEAVLDEGGKNQRWRAIFLAEAPGAQNTTGVNYSWGNHE